MTRLLRPKTIEQVMIDIGRKEQNPDLDILLSSDLLADICTRIVRLEKHETGQTSSGITTSSFHALSATCGRWFWTIDDYRTGKRYRGIGKNRWEAKIEKVSGRPHE